jgi:hypothetical protein
MKVGIEGHSKDELEEIVDAVVEAYLQELKAGVESERQQGLLSLQEQCRNNQRVTSELRKDVQRILNDLGAAVRPAVPHLMKLQRRSIYRQHERINRLLDDKLQAEIEWETLARSEEAATGREERQAFLRVKINVLDEKIKDQQAQMDSAVNRLQQMYASADDLEAKLAEQAELQHAVQRMEQQVQRWKSAPPTPVVLLHKADFRD